MITQESVAAWKRVQMENKTLGDGVNVAFSCYDDSSHYKKCVM